MRSIMRRSFPFFAAALLCSAATPSSFAADAAHGEGIYNGRCVACHSPDANRVGPKHRGVVGRTAGTVPGFNYSKAMRNSGVVWTEETLDKWLADPQAFIPGQRMNFKVVDPADRADLIAYLKTLTQSQTDFTPK
jgi:cytochrome c